MQASHLYRFVITAGLFRLVFSFASGHLLLPRVDFVEVDALLLIVFLDKGLYKHQILYKDAPSLLKLQYALMLQFNLK